MELFRSTRSCRGATPTSGCFNSLFVNANTSPEWLARTDLTAEQYQGVFDSCKGKGYRPLNMSAYRSGSETLFPIILVRDNNVQNWAARHHLSAASFAQQHDQYVRQGYQPACLCAYPWGEEVRYAAIWNQP